LIFGGIARYLGRVNTTSTRYRNLILIGFMGTGKTTIGKRVARSLGYRFVDTDQLIAKKAGKGIPAIFADEGEEAFRQLETEVLRECAAGERQVISTGGGIVTRPENRELLMASGYVVWLKAAPDTIYQRVRRSRDRPLLRTPDPQATIAELLGQRNGLYEASQHLTIVTDGLTPEETAFGVSESAQLVLEP
jgi:shikimate kinase